MALLSSAIALGLFLVYLRRRKKALDGRLSTLIEAALKEMVAELPWRERAWKAILSLYYPSTSSIAIPCALIGSLVVADRVASRWLGSADLSKLANLIAVEAGLTTILFPLILFIIETTADHSEMAVKKSEVLLKESFLFPVTVCALAALAGFSLVRTKYFAFAIVLVTTSSSIWALYQIVRLLLNDYWLMVSGRRLLQDKVRRSIWHAIRERLGNNILEKKLGEMGLKFYPWGFDDEREDTKLYRAESNGTVVDVDFNRLTEFITELPSARKGVDISDQTRSRADIAEKGPSIYFTPRLGAPLSKDVVLAVERYPQIGEAQQKVLESISRSVVTTKATENFTKILRAEINRLKGYMISSISDQRTDSVEIAVDHYKAIVEAFTEELLSINSVYSSESARKEIGSLLGGWDEINSVDDDVHEFIFRAVASDNVDVVHEVAFLPVAIAITALKAGDHYVFRRFLKYCRHFYQLSKTATDERVKTFLADRATRHLSEISDFYIEGELTRKNPTLPKLQSFRDYALEVLVVYQALAKTAMDRKEADDLREIIAAMSKRFDRFRPSQDTYRVETIERALESPNVSATQRGEFTERLPIQREREAAEAAIKRRRQQIILGLSALAVKRLEKSPDDAQLLAITNYLVSLAG